jgi:hypothetical protein
MKVSMIAAAALLALSIPAAVSATPRGPSSPTSEPGQSIGSCTTGVPRVTFHRAANYAGRTLTVCQSAARDLTTIHWDDGYCYSDDIFTTPNETCSNDAFSSYELVGPNSSHCAGTGATLDFYLDINYGGSHQTIHVPTNGGSLDADLSNGYAIGWNDRISSFTILCG